MKIKLFVFEDMTSEIRESPRATLELPGRFKKRSSQEGLLMSS